MSQFDEVQTRQESMQSKINALDDDLFVISDLPANLPKPYSDWIDPRHSLPSNVTYISGRTGISRLLLAILRIILPIPMIIGIGYTLIMLLTAAEFDDPVTGLLITVFFLVVGGFLLFLAVAYIIAFSGRVLTEIKMIGARSRGHFRYGLYLGPDALLTWLDKRCLVIPRVLIASASIEAIAYRSTTVNVTKLNFDNSIKDDVDAWLGSVEFAPLSLEQSPGELVSTINKWLADHK